MVRLILYGTAGCHLCHEAEALLAQTLARLEVAAEVEAVDIAGDAALTERYGVRIPVLRRPDAGAELGWPFGEEEIRALLQGSVAAGVPRDLGKAT